MTAPIGKKLKSRSGSSMVIAMLFLLFCGVVGGVALTAASANMGRDSRIRQQHRDYLMVESSALLLRDALSQLSFTGSYLEHSWTVTTVTPAQDGREGESSTQYGGPDYSFEAAGTAGTSQMTVWLEQELEALFEASVPESPQSYLPQSKELELALEAQDIQAQPVQVTLTLQRDYTIQVDLKDKNGANGMRFSLVPRIDRQEQKAEGPPVPAAPLERREDYYTRHTVNITWEATDVAKGEN